MIRSAAATLVPAALVLAASGVRADCIGPASTLAFSFPADGDDAVPVNAKIFVLPVADEVRLDGVALLSVDGVQWEPGPLEPSRAHVLDVDVPDANGDVVRSSITFTTGTGLAAPLDPATVQVTGFDEATVDDRACSHAVPYDCIDDAPHYPTRLAMASTAAVLWRTSGADQIYSGCTAFADVVDDGGRVEICYAVTAFAADGTSLSGEVCQPSPACAFDGDCVPVGEGEGEGDDDDDKDGCAASSMGSALGLSMLLASRRRLRERARS